MIGYIGFEQLQDDLKLLLKNANMISLYGFYNKEQIDQKETAWIEEAESKVDPEDIYTIEQINSRLKELNDLLATKPSIKNFYTMEQIDDKIKDLNDLIQLKAKKADVYTRKEINDRLGDIDFGNKALKTEVYTISEIEEKLEALKKLISYKISKELVYTKEEFNNKIAEIQNKANKNDFYNKQEVDTIFEELNEKINTIATTDNVYTKTEIDQMFAKFDNLILKTDVYTTQVIDAKLEQINTQLNLKVSDTTLYTKTQVDDLFNSVLAEMERLVDLSNYYTKTQVDTKIGTLVKTSDVVNNLTSTDTNKPLSANQGKILSDKIESLKQYASNQKQSVATAIASQDVEASSDNTWTELDQKLRDIVPEINPSQYLNFKPNTVEDITSDSGLLQYVDKLGNLYFSSDTAITVKSKDNVVLFTLDTKNTYSDVEYSGAVRAIYSDGKYMYVDIDYIITYTSIYPRQIQARILIYKIDGFTKIHDQSVPYSRSYIEYSGLTSYLNPSFTDNSICLFVRAFNDYKVNSTTYTSSFLERHFIIDPDTDTVKTLNYSYNADYANQINNKFRIKLTYTTTSAGTYSTTSCTCSNYTYNFSTNTVSTTSRKVFPKNNYQYNILGNTSRKLFLRGEQVYDPSSFLIVEVSYKYGNDKRKCLNDDIVISYNTYNIIAWDLNGILWSFTNKTTIYDVFQYINNDEFIVYISNTDSTYSKIVLSKDGGQLVYSNLNDSDLNAVFTFESVTLQDSNGNSVSGYSCKKKSSTIRFATYPDTYNNLPVISIKEAYAADGVVKFPNNLLSLDLSISGTSIRQLVKVPDTVLYMDNAFKSTGFYMEYLFTLDKYLPKNVISAKYAFNSAVDMDTTINLNGYPELKYANYMFSASDITTVLSIHDLPSIIDLSFIFLSCAKLLTAGDVRDLPELTTLESAFSAAVLLTSIGSIKNNPKLTSIKNICNGCAVLSLVGDIENCPSLVDATGAFQSTSLVEGPLLPNNIQNLTNIYYNCASLISVKNIPTSAINLYYAFYGCGKLTTLPELGNSVSNIGYICNGCTSLISVTNIPTSVTSAARAFYGCTVLPSIPSIEACTLLTDINNMCYNCTALTGTYVIPDSVTDMKYSFRSTLVTELTLPANISLDNIAYALYGCTQNVTVKIKSSGTLASSNTDSAIKQKIKGVTSDTSAANITIVRI